MAVADSSAKSSLFANLVAQELPPGSSEIPSENRLGLNPRLLNPFETLRFNHEYQANVEPIEILAEEQLPRAGFSESAPRSGYRRSETWAPDMTGALFNQSSRVIEPDARRDTTTSQWTPGQKLAADTANDKPQLNSSVAQNKSIDGALNPLPAAKIPRNTEADASRPIQAFNNERVHAVAEAVNHRIKPSPHLGQTPEANSLLHPRLIPAEPHLPGRLQPEQAKMPEVEKPAEPTIEIHIGRIEVRAQIQPAPSKSERVQSPSADTGGLQAYLQNRTRGARS